MRLPLGEQTAFVIQCVPKMLSYALKHSEVVRIAVTGHQQLNAQVKLLR